MSEKPISSRSPKDSSSFRSSRSDPPLRRFRSAAEAEEYLLGFINYELMSGYRATTRSHDLERFSELLLAMGWKPGATPTVHVGGTNGKGSVSWLIERLLRAGGVRTGLFSSPHLTDIRERVRIAGVSIARSRFRRDVSRLAEAYRTRRKSGFRTTFEHLTALALLAFQEARVRRAIVEVGLGGRLDATNVIPPGPAVITPIALDHQNILGRGLRRIATDKAHILKRGGTAFIMPQARGAMGPIEARVEDLGIPLIRTSREVQVEPVSMSPTGSVWNVRGREEYGTVGTRLLGIHQGDNMAAGVAVAESLLPAGRLRKAVGGLRGARVPGRLESIFAGGQRFLIDGGHNPAAGRAIAKAVVTHFPGARVIAVVGMARDKDHRGFFRALEPVVDRFVCCASGNPRAADPGDLAAATSGKVSTVRKVRTAMKRAAGSSPDVVLVCGSFILAGEARDLLKNWH